MSEESSSPKPKSLKRKLCVQCKINNYKLEESRALDGGFRRRAEFFSKRVADELHRIGHETNYAKLHVCNEHYEEIRKLRKTLFTKRRKTLYNVQLADVKRAQIEVNNLKLSHVEKILRLGPDHEYVFRAQIKLEHANRVLAQRIRRLKEIT